MSATRWGLLGVLVGSLATFLVLSLLPASAPHSQPAPIEQQRQQHVTELAGVSNLVVERQRGVKCHEIFVLARAIVSAASPFDCLGECQKDPMCQSVGYQAAPRRCHLFLPGCKTIPDMSFTAYFSLPVREPAPITRQTLLSKMGNLTPVAKADYDSAKAIFEGRGRANATSCPRFLEPIGLGRLIGGLWRLGTVVRGSYIITPEGQTYSPPTSLDMRKAIQRRGNLTSPLRDKMAMLRQKLRSENPLSARHTPSSGILAPNETLPAPLPPSPTVAAVDVPRPGLIPVTASDIRSFGVHAYVDPEHRLVYFGIPKVACSEWLRFFDRLWGHHDYSHYLHAAAPHFRFSDPNRARLLLSSFTPEQATEILNSPSFRKIVFFRDPAERLLSCYLDKFVRNHHYSLRVFEMQDRMNFTDFVDEIAGEYPPPSGVGGASNPHWRSQALVGNVFKFLPLMDYVGWSTAEHTKEILTKLGLWDDFGARGWPSPQGFMQRSGGSDGHQTGSKNKMEKYYTSELLQKVRRAYALDYAMFNEIGLRPNGPVVSGKGWSPRMAFPFREQHTHGNPASSSPGIPIPKGCFDA